ncbi:MAG: diguanylate cyclase [Acidaminobacteraceae bacterium]
MFSKGNHDELFDSIEAIGASFAIYEFRKEKKDFYLVSANTLYQDVLVIPIIDSINKDLKALFPRYIEKPIKEKILETRNNKLSTEVEIVIEHKEDTRWFRFIFSPIIGEDDDCHRVINTCIEITDKKKLENNLSIISKRYEAVVEAAYDGIVTIDENYNVNMINNSAKYIFDVKSEEIIGKPLTKLMPMKFRDKHSDYVKAFQHSSVNSRPMQSRAPVRGLRSDGSEFPIEVTISKIKVQDKTEMTAVIRDISERSKLVEELSKAAKEDLLTGLCNRRYFTELFLKEAERGKRFIKPVTIVMMDLDYFKKVNDVYGHAGGDHVLIEISKLIMDSKREIDVFSRWGGEEFMALLIETSLEEAAVWAERIREKIENLIMNFNGKDIKVTCSMGIVSREGMNVVIDSMLTDVDKMLYKAKASGRNVVVYK